MPRPPKPLRPERSPADWFGAELRYWREHRKLTQRELAQRVWVSTSLVGRIEVAERSCPPDLARRFDEVLETGGVLSRALRLINATEGDSDTKSEKGGKTADPQPEIRSPGLPVTCARQRERSVTSLKPR